MKCIQQLFRELNLPVLEMADLKDALAIRNFPDTSEGTLNDLLEFHKQVFFWATQQKTNIFLWGIFVLLIVIFFSGQRTRHVYDFFGIFREVCIAWCPGVDQVHCRNFLAPPAANAFSPHKSYQSTIWIRTLGPGYSKIPPSLFFSKNKWLLRLYHWQAVRLAAIFEPFTFAMRPDATLNANWASILFRGVDAVLSSQGPSEERSKSELTQPSDKKNSAEKQSKRAQTASAHLSSHVPRSELFFSFSPFWKTFPFFSCQLFPVF